MAKDRTGCGLDYGHDDEPGLRRRGRKHFTYVDERRRGREVTDARTLERIRRLAIPPAWTDVWISANPACHVQATGRDARGRKQYRYHPDFRRHRETTKFDQLPAFGAVLGTVRRTVEEDLDRRGLPLERVEALVVALLDRTYLRVGNESYARDNGSYGLTTLRDKHAVVRNGTIRLHFTGKSAKDHTIEWHDPQLARLVRRCQDLPGQVLFQWVDEDGTRHPVHSDEINRYLRDITGIDATAKTFRTWGASVLAATGLAAVADATPPPLRPTIVRRAMETVAEHLGNTPAVCRASYVHPKIIDTFNDGTLAERWHSTPKRRPRRLIAEEHRFLQLLAS
jgi:DNA topoisomerase-1